MPACAQATDIIPPVPPLHPPAPCSTAARLLPPTLTAVNTFLLGNGRDCAAQAAALHGALHALVLGGLGAKDGRLREAAATYLRCQLQLGSLPVGSAQLQDVQDWVERELEAPSLKWWVGWWCVELCWCCCCHGGKVALGNLDGVADIPQGNGLDCGALPC